MKTKFLFDAYPELAKEWHPTKNGDLTPYNVAFGSGKKVWWVCKKGHEWLASVNSRTNIHSGCPYCARNRVTIGANDLATINPELAAQWHPTKNGGLTPSKVTSGSSKKVWWICPEGHEWSAVINNRSHGSGCPHCSGRSAIAGVNDLCTTHPQLAAQWHPKKNGRLLPSDVKRTSSRRVWWRCSEGHVWSAFVSSRKSDASCPYCDTW